MIDLSEADVLAVVNLASDRMISKASTLGPRVSERPDLEGSNSVFGLVVHCAGVAEWWLDHAIVGRESSRDRNAEFDASGTLAELETLVAQFRSRLPAIVKAAVRSPLPESSYIESATTQSRAWPWTTASIVFHVIEELLQHAGHVDITADLLAGAN